jgi:hypothetical protein
VSSRRLVVGVLLIALGGLFLGEYLGWWSEPGDLIGRWWPVALILGALVVVARDPSRWVGALIVGVIGAAFLIETTDVAELDGGLVAPLLLVAVGALVLLRPRRQRAGSESNAAAPIEPVGHNRVDV